MRWRGAIQFGGMEISYASTSSVGAEVIDVDDDDDDDEGNKLGDGSTGQLKVANDVHLNNENDRDGVTEDTPSPPRVILDLIDATCHEIIHLGGEDTINFDDDNDDDEVKEFIMPTGAAYAELAQRLGYYMGLLKQGYPNGEEQQQHPIVLEKGTDIWYRLVMAKLILDIFAKEAYPEKFQDIVDWDGPNDYDGPKNSLMDMAPSRWSKLRYAFTELRDAFHGRDVQKPIQQPGMTWANAHNSIICAMEGFEALATLTKKLRALPARINDPDDIKEAMKLSRVEKYVEQYKATSERIGTMLDTEGSRKYFEHLFIRTDLLPTVLDDVPDPPDRRTLKDWMGSLYIVFVAIKGAFIHQKFPVQQFKFVLLNTLKNWEGMYLPKTVLFSVDRYFKFKGEEALSSSIATESKEDIVPEKDGVTSRRHPKKEMELSLKPEKKMRRAKRIPFTEVEKECLLKGVKKFGVGSWAKILDHYRDVFQVNDRSNVNLKDLYRNLTKVKAGEEWVPRI
ncbi:hypothetical protein ACHAWU_009825 [Discostella pseudostelligera]|uniref:HTH myb-type domain-containing protein n=1 Tax=Discostella pseudostelligera TaxID=259834 RepID=A0ABD3M6Z1_9STRA